MKMHILAHLAPRSNRIDLLIKQIDGNTLAIGRGVLFEVVPEGQEIEPTLSLPIESAQELMDSLWQCGLRPSEGSGSAGALRATQNHLEDMRKIVFKMIEEKI